MTNSKNTRRALLISVLTMTLSFVMLIGTTFAWFTDSVSSGKNKIVAGNLDIEVTHTNNNVENEELKDAKLFPVELWEPGVVSYETFTVKNAGSLAFDYTFSLNVSDFNTIEGTEKSLKDVIKLGILEGSVGEMTREELVAAVKAVEAKEDSIAKNFTSFSGFSFKGNMEEANTEKTFTMVAYWEPTENDNDYNVNGGKTVNKLNGDKNELYIEIVVNVVAKQKAYEKDSFGSDYDSSSDYAIGSSERVQALVAAGYIEAKTIEDLSNALASNVDAKIVLSNNLVSQKTLSPSKNATIDLNGNKLSSTGILMHASKGKEVVVKNGTLRSDNSIPAYNSGGLLTLENVDIESLGTNTYAGVTAYYDGTTNVIGGSIVTTGVKAGGVYADNTSVMNVKGTKIVTEAYGVTAMGESNVTLDDCDILSSKGYGVVTNGSYSKEATLTIKNSKISSSHDGTVIYLPAGTIMLEDCTVGGPVVICGGNVTINGGTYTTYGYATEAPYVFDEEATMEFIEKLKAQDGAGHMGDSILIIDRRTNGYDMIAVTIKNATFNTQFIDENGDVRVTYAIKYVDFDNKAGATTITPIIENNIYNDKLESGIDPVLICGQN